MKIDRDLEKKILAAWESYATSNEWIKAEIDLASEGIYKYTKFESFIDDTSVNVAELLEDLCERKFLERHIQDRTMNCKACDSAHVNIREVCPSCGSLHWQKKVLYHHFSCGYVGLESEFKQQSMTELYCPKCEEQLRHIGLDYEKPTESFYCNDCEHIFTEHDVQGLCLSCGEKTPVEDLKVTEVYSYDLTTKAYQALEMKTLKNISFENLIKDQNSSVYSYDYFVYLLDQQRPIAFECKDVMILFLLTGQGVKQFCDFVSAKLKPGYFITVRQEACYICGTRSSEKVQREYFQKLLRDFVDSSDYEVQASFTKVELETPFESQVDDLLNQHSANLEDSALGELSEI